MRLILVPVLALAAVAAAVVGFASPLLHHRAVTPLLFHGTTGVFAIPLAGGAPREVLRLRGQWGFPVATPDGRAVVLEKPFLDHTEVWRVPLDGARPTRAGTMPVFTAPAQRGRFRASVSHAMHPGILDVRNPSGSVAWRRHVPAHTEFQAVSPDGRSVVIPRDEGLEVLTAHSRRYLVRGGTFFDPAFSADGKTVYVLRLNDATSIPK